MRNNILTDPELNNLAKVCDVLEHFDKAGEILSGEKYETSSLVLPTLSFLKKKMGVVTNDSAFKANLKKELRE